MDTADPLNVSVGAWRIGVGESGGDGGIAEGCELWGVSGTIHDEWGSEVYRGMIDIQSELILESCHD